MTITTHVLDTARGRPAAGIAVVLEHNDDQDEWRVKITGETDSDGRVKNLASAASFAPGRYRLVFGTAAYFEKLGVRTFYPEVMIVFETAAGESHYHVPLLLNAFGYTTYRGS